MAIGNHEADKFLERLEPFTTYTKSLRATRDETEYRVYSYGTLIALVELATPTNGKGAELAYLDRRQYSVTTSKHQGIIAMGLSGLPQSDVATIYRRPKRR